MARPAVLGPKIYRAVEKLRSEDGMSIAAACQYISQNKDKFDLEDMKGVSAGTVQANYYRQQRKENGSESPSERRDRQQSERRETSSSSDDGDIDVEEIATMLQETLKQLLDRLRTQERELEQERERREQVSQLLRG